MSSEEVNIDFTPNKPQKHLLENMKRFNIFECHRRAGKSYLGMMLLIFSCLNTKYHNARYGFVAPEEKQGDRNMADTLVDLAMNIPGTKYIKNEKKITFVNGASIFLLGIKNKESFRGGFWDGLVLDEFRDMDDAEYTWNHVIYPSLMKWETPERQGWVLITTTPPQKKHFYLDLYKRAINSDQWYVHKFPIDETELFTKKQIEEFRSTMTPTAFAIELMCSHDIPADGAYFGEALLHAEETNRIGEFKYDPSLGVYAALDIGKDGTAIWYAQKKDDKFYMIDYDQSLDTDKNIGYYINLMKGKPYAYNRIFLPHDSVKKYQTAEYSAYMLFKNRFKNLVKVLQREFIDDSIYRVNGNFYKCWFNAGMTHEGRMALREYSPKINKDGTVTNKIDHNWASHGADAFRYLIQGLTTCKDRIVDDIFEDGAPKDILGVDFNPYE